MAAKSRMGRLRRAASQAQAEEACIDQQDRSAEDREAQEVKGLDHGKEPARVADGFANSRVFTPREE